MIKAEKYTIALCRSRDYKISARVNVYISGNNLEKLLRRVERSISRAHHPWHFVHVMRWDKEAMKSETVLGFWIER